MDKTIEQLTQAGIHLSNRMQARGVLLPEVESLFDETWSDQVRAARVVFEQSGDDPDILEWVARMSSRLALVAALLPIPSTLATELHDEAKAAMHRVLGVPRSKFPRLADGEV